MIWKNKKYWKIN